MERGIRKGSAFVAITCFEIPAINIGVKHHKSMKQITTTFKKNKNRVDKNHDFFIFFLILTFFGGEGVHYDQYFAT